MIKKRTITTKPVPYILNFNDTNKSVRTRNASIFLSLLIIPITHQKPCPIMGQKGQQLFYCICRDSVQVLPGLRRRGGNGERRSRAHGVARSHWRVLYHIRRNEITVQTKCNPPRKLPRRSFSKAGLPHNLLRPSPSPPLILLAISSLRRRAGPGILTLRQCPKTSVEIYSC